MKTNPPTEPQTQLLTEQARQLSALTQAILERAATEPNLSEQNCQKLLTALAGCSAALESSGRIADAGYSDIFSSLHKLNYALTAFSSRQQQETILVTDCSTKLTGSNALLAQLLPLLQTLIKEVRENRTDLNLVRAELKRERQERDLEIAELSAVKRHLILLNSQIAACNKSAAPPDQKPRPLKDQAKFVPTPPPPPRHESTQR